MKTNVLLVVLFLMLSLSCNNQEDFECSGEYEISRLVHDDIKYFAATASGLVEIGPSGSFQNIESSLDSIFLEDFSLYNFTPLQSLEFLPPEQMNLRIAGLPINLDGTISESVIDFQLDEQGVMSSPDFEALTGPLQANLDRAMIIEADCSSVSSGLKMIRFINLNSALGDLVGTEISERKFDQSITDIAESASQSLGLTDGDSIVVSFARMQYE